MNSQQKRFLFFSPECNSMEESCYGPSSSPTLMVDQRPSGSLSVGKFVLSPLSPMTTDQDQMKPGSISATPRRKLSMSVDENVQSPLTDPGYGDNIGDSCSSESWKSTRSPLSEIPASDFNGGVRRTLLAKRTIQNKENVFPPVSHRPLSLSSSPTLCQDPQSSWETKGGKNFVRQISSPLERMHIVSPTTHLIGQSSFSRPPSTNSVLSDGYFSEVFCSEEMENEPVLSNTISSLINAPFNDPTPMTKAVSIDDVVCPTPCRPPNCHHQDGSELSSASVKEPEDRGKKGTLKRSSPQSDTNKLHHRKKRPPLPFMSEDSPPNYPRHGVSLLRSQSLSAASLAGSNPTPFSPGSGEEGYIGDKSKSYALPLVKGNCRDLKCISPETMCDLLKGNYSDIINHYTIIDCRFPYEYEGGHITGAKNIWRQDELLEFCFSEPLQHPREEYREVFVFHCEFSSKRGPKMSRFLRETDRKKNGSISFPKLYYPELYLLDGGYRSFFEFHKEMCEPQSYRCMVDENHTEEFRNCKLRSKSWNGGECQTRRRPAALRRHRHSTTASTNHHSKGSDL